MQLIIYVITVVTPNHQVALSLDLQTMTNTTSVKLHQMEVSGGALSQAASKDILDPISEKIIAFGHKPKLIFPNPKFLLRLNQQTSLWLRVSMWNALLLLLK